MIPAGHHIWRLSEGGDHNFGLSCTEEGLFLGRTPLVERRDGAYTVRSGSDLQRLLSRTYGADIKVDRVMPGGVPIGTPGRGYNVRELREGTKAAGELFDYLSVGGTVYRSESNLTIIKLPGKSSFVTYRPVSTSGPPAIDINIPGIRFMRLHFVGD